MKVIIYNAISVDGFIARDNDDTDWVCDTDWKIFSRIVKSSKAIVMGRKTYQTSGEDFPYDCDLNVVMTKNKKLVKKSKPRDGIVFRTKKLENVIEEVEKKGFKKLLIIGGGKLNGSFLKKNLVDEIIVDIHPIILGKGIKLFQGEEYDKQLKRVNVRTHNEGLVQVKYKVKR